MSLVLALSLLFPQAPEATPPAVAAPSPLTADEAAALEVIDERVVRAGIAFLASDELGGRDTPSPGLRVASAYVAARFVGAGLEGLGRDGSYYLESEVTTTALPASGVAVADGSGRPLPHLGLLQADRENALEFEGALFDAGSGLPTDGVSPYPDEPVDAVVIVDQAKPERVRRGFPARYAMIGPLRRQVQEAERRGARALLIRVTADSPLVDMAEQLRGKGVMRDQLRFARLPILLVPGDFATESVALRIPARVVEPAGLYNNVCGILRGSDPVLSAEAIVVSAHLDHVGTRGSGDADSIYNGADDDATGVCGVLGLADAFAALEKRPARTMLFVTFWGEERGLLGSRDFCENPPWPLEKIVANVNLEMLGRPEEGAQHKTWMTGWTKSNLGDLMALGAKRAGVEVFHHKKFSPMLYGASDNASFVRRGVIGHSFSAGSMHDDYHQVTDEWQKLDLPHMTVVIRGLFTGTLPLAQGLYTPEKTAK